MKHRNLVLKEVYNYLSVIRPHTTMHNAANFHHDPTIKTRINSTMTDHFKLSEAEEQQIEAELARLEPPKALPDPFACVVIVDGLPVVPAAKLEKLKSVLRKLFVAVGPFGPEDMNIVTDAEGNTLGCVFAVFVSVCRFLFFFFFFFFLWRFVAPFVRRRGNFAFTIRRRCAVCFCFRLTISRHRHVILISIVCLCVCVFLHGFASSLWSARINRF
jgi:hypothetical protein